MNPRIKQLKSTTFHGRQLTRRQIADIQQTVSMCSRLSRRELAHTICEHLRWRTAGGSDRVQLCLRVLEQLERHQILQLPPKVKYPSQRRQSQLQWTAGSEAQAQIKEQLSALLPLRLQLAETEAELRLWKELVDRHHYLGYKHPIGASMRYFAVDQQGRKLACIGFCFAVQKSPCRDEWIGWQQQQHKKHLRLVVNQNRFLILPWVKVKNLASKLLSMCTRQLADDWQCQHGYRPVLIETFVDESRFQGSCYRAANWQYLGTTEKRSGKTQKGVYAYALEAQAKTILKQGRKAVRAQSKPAQVSSL